MQNDLIGSANFSRNINRHHRSQHHRSLHLLCQICFHNRRFWKDNFNTCNFQFHHHDNSQRTWICDVDFPISCTSSICHVSIHGLCAIWSWASSCYNRSFSVTRYVIFALQIECCFAATIKGIVCYHMRWFDICIVPRSASSFEYSQQHCNSNFYGHCSRLRQHPLYCLFIECINSYQRLHISSICFVFYDFKFYSIGRKFDAHVSLWSNPF